MSTTPRVSVTRQWVRVGPASVYCERAGRGEPLILLHGLSGSSRWWARNIHELAQHFDVHAIDLIGWGHTRCEQSFVLREAAWHLVAWMDALDIERAAVAGHSMGGFIAADLAADYPDRVSSLVLVDAAALTFDAAGWPAAGEVLQALRYLPGALIQPLLLGALQAGPRTIFRAARELLGADIRRKLAAIAAPTLVVWGAHDPLIPLSVGRRLCQLLPAATLAIVEDAGHNPMWEQPRVFNRLVADFLRTGALATTNAARGRRAA